MSISCIIRFADGNGSATVRRKRHGHPEDVISSLSVFRQVVDQQPVFPDPGTTAVQFLAIDVLQYLYLRIPIEEFGYELETLFSDPGGVDKRVLDAFSEHAVLGPDTLIADVPFVYEISTKGADSAPWTVGIGTLNGEQALLQDIEDVVHWWYRDTLANAQQKFD